MSPIEREDKAKAWLWVALTPLVTGDDRVHGDGDRTDGERAAGDAGIDELVAAAETRGRQVEQPVAVLEHPHQRAAVLPVDGRPQEEHLWQLVGGCGAGIGQVGVARPS